MNASISESAWPLIWINGFPGTGKQTIAKLLATLLEGDPVVIDNHSLIDQVAKNFSRDHPGYQKERRRVREDVFKNYVEDPGFRTRIVVFTDFQSDNDLGRDVAREYEAAALRARRPFLPVYLECSIEENKGRIASSQRKSSGTTKLFDPEILAGMRARCKLFRFDGVKDITCDVTNMGPEEAAEALKKDVMKLWK